MKKLGVIGTGIAGMSAAYFLREEYEITLFEKNNYIGGHTNTIDVHDGKKLCPTDTGFMVFNEKTYPNLVKLFTELDVPIKNTCMSFSVRNEDLNLEYNGTNINGLFAQRKNIFNIKFLKMLKEVLKFNDDALNMLEQERFESMTIGEYVQGLGLSDYFFKNFLVPMSSAVWSTPMEKMKNFPAKSLVRFFHNHGFVGVDTQLQWKTVDGGSREYRDRLLSKLSGPTHISQPVKSVSLSDEKVKVQTHKDEYLFDKVIIAAHADEALEMLSNPTDFQKEVLSKFSYQENIAIVHSDDSVMPNLKKNWSSWNFMMRGDEAYTVYYMNRLQEVSELKNIFININGEEFVNKNKIINRIVYHHPLFDIPAVKAQAKMDELNRSGPIHFTGSYYRYGFHEDGLLSSVNLCKSILEREVFS